MLLVFNVQCEYGNVALSDGIKIPTVFDYYFVKLILFRGFFFLDLFGKHYPSAFGFFCVVLCFLSAFFFFLIFFFYCLLAILLWKASFSIFLQWKCVRQFCCCCHGFKHIDIKVIEDFVNLKIDFFLNTQYCKIFQLINVCLMMFILVGWPAFPWKKEILEYVILDTFCVYFSY